MRRLIVLCLSIVLFGISPAKASEHAYPLESVKNNLRDKASLQRGAQVYMNHCLGCHSLEYTRYIQLGEYLGIQGEDGKVLEKLVQDNLNFVTDKVTDKVINSMHTKDAAKWFGTPPPDLTLVTRVRGKDWVYTYLKSFYVDETRPWGVNNAVFPDVAMPHVLLDLQGQQEGVFKTVYVTEEGQRIGKPVLEGLKVSTQGELDPKAYDATMTDLVNFLEFIGEPVKEKRTRLGVFVVLFLVVLTVFLYALKREFWKDVH